MLLVGLSILPYLSRASGWCTCAPRWRWAPVPVLAERLRRDVSRANARVVFLYSLVYLALLFAAIGVDRINLS